MVKNYDEWSWRDAKLIVREDFRVYYYMVDPMSNSHRSYIKMVQEKVDKYFQDKDIPVSRKIHTSAQGKRMMWINFGDINDSTMFYMALGEHIDTKGVTFERFASE